MHICGVTVFLRLEFYYRAVGQYAQSACRRLSARCARAYRYRAVVFSVDNSVFLDSRHIFIRRRESDCIGIKFGRYIHRQHNGFTSVGKHLTFGKAYACYRRVYRAEFHVPRLRILLGIRARFSVNHHLRRIRERIILDLSHIRRYISRAQLGILRKSVSRKVVQNRGNVTVSKL